jgi:hypothetical protein
MDECNSLARDALTLLGPRFVLERGRLCRPPILAIGTFRDAAARPSDELREAYKMVMIGIRSGLINQGLVMIPVGSPSLEGSMADFPAAFASLPGAFGKGPGRAPDFIFLGDIAAITYSEGRTSNTDYAFNWVVFDVATGMIVAAHQEQISKQFSQGLYGG